jgi:hypothetical protein
MFLLCFTLKVYDRSIAINVAWEANIYRAEYVCLARWRSSRTDPDTETASFFSWKKDETALISSS